MTEAWHAVLQKAKLPFGDTRKLLQVHRNTKHCAFKLLRSDQVHRLLFSIWCSLLEYHKSCGALSGRELRMHVRKVQAEGESERELNKEGCEGLRASLRSSNLYFVPKRLFCQQLQGRGENRGMDGQMDVSGIGPITSSPLIFTFSTPKNQIRDENSKILQSGMFLFWCLDASLASKTATAR